MWLHTSNPQDRHQGLTGTIVGNYRLVRELGHGTLGTVFEARHERIGKRAAVKVLGGGYFGDARQLERALAEAQVLSAIEHPGIVAIYDCAAVHGGAAAAHGGAAAARETSGLAIVMELVQGERLSERLVYGRLPVLQAARIARQIAAAVRAGHGQGVLHMDLKPDNVMLIRDPEAAEGERVKVMDLGLWHMLAGAGAAGAQEADVLLGSPRYLAPEQCRGGCSVDGQADVYALGVVLYQMLAGQPPFVARGQGELLAQQILEAPPPLNERAPEAPRALVELVHRMLAKDPRARPQMAEVEAALQAAAPPVSQPARVVTPLSLPQVVPAPVTPRVVAAAAEKIASLEVSSPGSLPPGSLQIEVARLTEGARDEWSGETDVSFGLEDEDTVLAAHPAKQTDPQPVLVPAKRSDEQPAALPPPPGPGGQAPELSVATEPDAGTEAAAVDMEAEGEAERPGAPGPATPATPQQEAHAAAEEAAARAPIPIERPWHQMVEPVGLSSSWAERKRRDKPLLLVSCVVTLILMGVVYAWMQLHHP